MFQSDMIQYGFSQADRPFPRSHRKPALPPATAPLGGSVLRAVLSFAGLVDGAWVSPVRLLRGGYTLAARFDVPVIVTVEARRGIGGWRVAYRGDGVDFGGLVKVRPGADVRLVVTGTATGAVQLYGG